MKTALAIFCLFPTLNAAEPKVGHPADLKFTAVDGRKVNLTNLRGKVVLLYFCASWCPPCVFEFPKVKSVYDKLHPHGFEILGISLERTRTKFDDYTKRNKIPWPQLIVEWNGPMMKQFNVRAIPAEILIDQKGNIAHLDARQNLEEKVRALLALPDQTKQWGQWRGPLATGFAPAANPPTEWSETKNMCWKTPLPGLGHSSPVVWDNYIYLTSAVPQGEKLPVPEQPLGAHNNLDPFHKLRFTVLAINRHTGKITWQSIVHTAQPHQSAHESATWASNSPVTDGRHVIAPFGSAGLYCLNAKNGTLIWKKDLGNMQVKHGHGEGASPVLHGNTVVINWDHEGDSFAVALDKRTGKELWRNARNEPTSWSTPIAVEHNGKSQVIISATAAVRGYDLATGKVLWHVGGLPHNVVASPVYANGIVYAGASYEKRTMLAIKLDGAKGDLIGTKSILWTRRAATPYVPSPLLMPDNTLYFFHHYQGFLSKVNGLTGKDAGPFRLGGMRNFYASPVGAKGRVYLTDRAGNTLVLSHEDQSKPLARNKLNDSFSASPAIVGDALFLRGERFLYCLGSGAGTD